MNDDYVVSTRHVGKTISRQINAEVTRYIEMGFDEDRLLIVCHEMLLQAVEKWYAPTFTYHVRENETIATRRFRGIEVRGIRPTEPYLENGFRIFVLSDNEVG